MLAALVLVHPDTTIIVGFGFGAWLLLSPLGKPRPSRRGWLLATIAIPLIALMLVLPWMLSVRHLLGGEISSPFERFPEYWRIILSVPPEMLYHGGMILPIAIVGLVIGLWRRSQATLLAIGWMVLILEFAWLGLLERMVPLLVAPILRYDYPFSIAWHGPILPYILLAGLLFATLWERFITPRLSSQNAHRIAYTLLALIAAGAVTAGVFNREMLAASKGRVTFFGAFASHADVAAMSWLRENTSADAYILNWPGPQEGDWVPVIAERRSVYYRPQPFFTREGDPLVDTQEQLAMRTFWEDPANPDNEALLREAGVDYVIVPQVVGNPDSFADHYRWRRPFTDLIDMASDPAGLPYLMEVFDADGARVYRVE
jgi:hypothetical protein